MIMCGVRFMAETVKILSPEKKVILSDSQAGRPMAEQFTKDAVLELKKEHPAMPLWHMLTQHRSLKRFAMCA